MPLTERIAFTTVLQRGNRVQVPRLVRWRFKMEPNQVLRVGVLCLDLLSGWQYFYARMGKEGRILLPKLTLDLLMGQKVDAPDLCGRVLDVTIEPV